MAQWLRALAVITEDTGSVPSTPGGSLPPIAPDDLISFSGLALVLHINPLSHTHVHIR